MSSRCHISGFIAEIETYFSPDTKLVNSETGDRAAFTDSRTMVSCLFGIKYVVFLSSLKTICMAASCSRICEIILCCDPHLCSRAISDNCMVKKSFWNLCLCKAISFFQLCMCKMSQNFLTDTNSFCYSVFLPLGIGYC